MGGFFCDGWGGGNGREMASCRDCEAARDPSAGEMKTRYRARRGLYRHCGVGLMLIATGSRRQVPFSHQLDLYAGSWSYELKLGL